MRAVAVPVLIARALAGEWFPSARLRALAAPALGIALGCSTDDAARIMVAYQAGRERKLAISDAMKAKIEVNHGLSVSAATRLSIAGRRALAALAVPEPKLEEVAT